MAYAIEIDHLAFAWQGGQLTLDIPHWQVETGESVLLRGPSGSGKSTLLSLLAGINVAQQGNVSLLDQSLSNLSGRKRDRFRANHIGYIFQQFNLLPYLSALDNVLLATQFSPKRRQRVAESGQSAEQLAIQYLQRLGLSASQQQQAAAKGAPPAPRVKPPPPRLSCSFYTACRSLFVPPLFCIAPVDIYSPSPWSFPFPPSS